MLLTIVLLKYKKYKAIINSVAIMKIINYFVIILKIFSFIKLVNVFNIWTTKVTNAP